MSNSPNVVPTDQIRMILDEVLPGQWLELVFLPNAMLLSTKEFPTQALAALQRLIDEGVLSFKPSNVLFEPTRTSDKLWNLDMARLKLYLTVPLSTWLFELDNTWVVQVKAGFPNFATQLADALDGKLVSLGVVAAPNGLRIG